MHNWRVVLRATIGYRNWNFGKKSLLFLAVIGGAWLITWLVAGERYTYNQYYTLFLTLLAIGFWVTEAVPAFAVGLFIIGFQVLTLGNKFYNPEPFDTQLFTSTIANPVVWLMLGGFFLAAGMRRAGMDQQLLLKTIEYFGPSPKRLLLGVMLSTMTLSMVMSNTAATAMMIAMVLPFLRSLGSDSSFRSSFILGVPTAATLGGMGTLIGSPPNAIAAGVLENAGQPVSFVAWVLYGLLPAILLTIASWRLLVKIFPAELKEINSRSVETNAVKEPISQAGVWVVRFTLLLTILGWLTASIHKVPVHLIAMIPVVVLPLANIVAAEDFNTMNWDTLVLVAGGLSLGAAIIETGLADRMLAGISLEGIPVFWLALFFGYLSMILSNIVSNTATAAILIPVAVQLDPDHMGALAGAIALSASCALLLPVSTPPNALAFATGFIKQKQFRYAGLLVGLLGPLIICCWLFLIG